ncbi:site-specific DNA-methyltransferase [Pseudomonadota bacterium]|nr:site-specific DNA-methyltransferase [Pseudomonadota bacterium]
MFTDPPYGDSIAYLGLSMFFNSWLGDIPQYSKEIIFDPYRNKKHDDYSSRLSKVFLELNRILKPGKFLSFTFHNRDLLIWKSVIDAVKNAGFIMKHLTYQEQAVASGTQGINFKNTFRGDFVYNFYKPVNSKKIILKKKKSSDPLKLINKKIDKLFKNNNFITSDYLYEEMIPYIVKNDIYLDLNKNPIDLEQILSLDYEYTESLKKKNIFGWQRKKN